jgi:hypothetical protein
MFWVLIYISTNFLAPIPCISLRIADFSSHFLPKSKNFATRISQKNLNQLKPDLRPVKASAPAKAGPSRRAGQRFAQAFLPRSPPLDLPSHSFNLLVRLAPQVLLPAPPQASLRSHHTTS